MLVAVGVLAALWAGVPGLSVVAQPADAVCPGPGLVDAALETRLGPGAAGTGAGSDSWVLRYEAPTANAGATGGSLRLTLQDPSGRSRLDRDLSTAGEPCEQRADAIALIVERFFRGIGWTAGAALPGASASAAVAPPTPVSPSPPAPIPAPAHDGAAPLPPRLAVGGGAVLLGGRAPLVGVGLDVSARIGGSLAASVGVVLPPGEATAAVGAGSATVRSLPIRASGRWVWRVQSFRLAAGPEGLLAWESGRTRDIAQPGSESRRVLSVGVVGAADLLVSPRWQVGIEAASHYTVLAHRFTVGGAGEVLRPPRLQGLILARVGVVLFP